MDWGKLLTALKGILSGRMIGVVFTLPTGYTEQKRSPMSTRWTYFSEAEVKGLHSEFVAKLDLARKVAGVPFIIASGFRTPENNKSVIGAVPDSAHLKGVAVDLVVKDDSALSRVIEGAFSAGIDRIGIYFDRSEPQPRPTHVHLDDDTEKVHPTMWLKREGTPA